ncbi:MAG TPA: hypothetical protein VMH27_05390 [Puia sp.]|nr:hypothetical protein [Puia sp.]
MNRIVHSAILAIGLFSASTTIAQTIPYHFDADHDSLTTNVPLNEICARAFRNFVKFYGFVKTAVWNKQSEGISVRFYTPDSILYVVHYTTRGRALDTHVYYTGRNAPSRVCSDVRSYYPKYTMLFVNELDDHVTPVFEVGLLDDHKFLLVRVKEDQVTPVESFDAFVSR